MNINLFSSRRGSWVLKNKKKADFLLYRKTGPKLLVCAAGLEPAPARIKISINILVLLTLGNK
jgi:hypothetical protein